MNDEQQVPTWPGYAVFQLNEGIWAATTTVNGMTLAVSSASRDAAVSGLHIDVRREQGVDLAPRGVDARFQT